MCQLMSLPARSDMRNGPIAKPNFSMAAIDLLRRRALFEHEQRLL